MKLFGTIRNRNLIGLIGQFANRKLVINILMGQQLLICLKSFSFIKTNKKCKVWYFYSVLLF